MDEYDKLKLLRQETKLGWISIFRIRRECRKAEYIRNICAANDPKHIYSADYTNANRLELKLRMDVLKEALAPAFEQYKKVERDGLVLEEFANNYLDNCRLNRDIDKGKGRTFTKN